MHHAFVDNYSGTDSFIHRLDPRSKIVGVFSFILFVVFTRPESFIKFVLYTILISLLILGSKIPISQIIKRLFVIIPFVVMVAIFVPFLKDGKTVGSFSAGPFNIHVTYDGLLILWSVFIKSLLSTLSMAFLLMSTNFTSLFKALEYFHLPNIFIMIISFMYRYVFVIEDEFMKMSMARQSRSFGGSSWFHTKVMANTMAVMFLKSFERGENVYLAMCSRGFNGSIKTLSHLHFHMADYYFIGLVLVTLTIIRTV